jgi:hypothetical protein
MMSSDRAYCFQKVATKSTDVIRSSILFSKGGWAAVYSIWYQLPEYCTWYYQYCMPAPACFLVPFYKKRSDASPRRAAKMAIRRSPGEYWYLVLYKGTIYVVGSEDRSGYGTHGRYC